MEKDKSTNSDTKEKPERKLPACDNCYKFKRKCDRNFPTCSTCARNQRICVYSRRRVRSLLVQSSTLTLEERLAHIESLLSISPKNVIQNREAIISNLNSLAEAATTSSNIQNDSAMKDKRSGDELKGSKKKKQKVEVDKNEGKKKAKIIKCENHTFINEIKRFRAANINELLMENYISSTDLVKDFQCEIKMELIKIYFTHINHNIPFIKKADFLQKLNNQSTFLLISLYSITSILDPIINKKDNSQCDNNGMYEVGTNPPESEKYFDFAYKLMPIYVNEQKITTVQALLILSFYSLLANKMHLSRMYANLAKQMLFDMRFQYDSLINSENTINLKMKPILNIQRRLWYCTYILHVFSLLNSNIPITSFIDSFLVPFPDDDKSFNEEITIPNNNMNNNYSNGNSMNDYNYELDKKNFPMTSSFSFNENMNRDYMPSKNGYEIENFISEFAENDDVKMCSEVPEGYIKELITLTRLTAENFSLVKDRELNSLIHCQSTNKRELVEKTFLLNSENEKNKKFKNKAKEYGVIKQIISSASNPYDYNPCCCFDTNAFSKLIVLDYDFQDWLKYLDEKFKDIPSPVTPENFTVFRSTSNLHLLWNWNQMHLHRPLFCNCNDENCSICCESHKKGGRKNSKSTNDCNENNQQDIKEDNDSHHSNSSSMNGYINSNNNDVNYMNQPPMNNQMNNVRSLDISSIINNDDVKSSNQNQDQSINIIWPTTESFKICEIMAANISSLLSTYLMLNPLLDHFNPLFIEAVYESTINHILVMLYPPDDFPKDKLNQKMEHTFKLIKLNQLVISRLSNIWPYARRFKDSIESLISSSGLCSIYNNKNE